MIDERKLNELENFVLHKKANSCKLTLSTRKEPAHDGEIFGHYVCDMTIEVAGVMKTFPNIAAIGDTNIADYDTPWGRKRRAVAVGTAFVLPIAKHLQSKGINVTVDAPIEGIMFIRDILQLPYGQMI